MTGGGPTLTFTLSWASATSGAASESASNSTKQAVLVMAHAPPFDRGNSVQRKCHTRRLGATGTCESAVTTSVRILGRLSATVPCDPIAAPGGTMPTRRLPLMLVCAVLTLCAGARPARAEVSELRLARQFGIASVPLMVMQHQKLLEKHLKAAGLATTVEWKQFSGGSTMNDALLSGALHIGAGGVPPLLTIWDKTKGTSDEVKGVAALGSMPLVLITNNPKVKTIKDFTEKDKIAVPAVKVSIQAVFLQIVAARTFGDEHYARLDAMTVSMPHPTAFAALMSGTEVTG